jgi:hypothetical protein
MLSSTLLDLCGEVSYVQNQFVIGVSQAFAACLLTIRLRGPSAYRVRSLNGC